MIQRHCPKCKHRFLSPDESGEMGLCPACGYQWQILGRSVAPDAATAESDQQEDLDEDEVWDEAAADSTAEFLEGLPEEIQKLGMPLAVYTCGDPFVANVAVKIVAGMFGLGLCYVGFVGISDAVTEEFWKKYGLPVFLALIGFFVGGLWILFISIGHLGSAYLRAALVYPDRWVSILFPQKIRAIAWSEIETVWMDVKSHGLGGWYLCYEFRLRDRNGQTLVLKSYPNQMLEGQAGEAAHDPAISELHKRIRKQVYPRLLARAQDLLRAGEAASFGSVAVCSTRLNIGGKETSWTQISEIVVDQGLLVVSTISGVAIRVKVADLDNFHVLLDLLKEVCKAPPTVKSWIRRGLSKRLLGWRTPAANRYALEGQAALDKDDHELAVACCTEALRLDPRNAVARHARAQAFLEATRYQEALAEWNELLRVIRQREVEGTRRGEIPRKHLHYLDPYDEANAYDHRGWTYHKSGDLERAIADFTEAIRLKPELAAAYWHRSQAYAQQGDAVKSKSDRRKAFELDPDADQY